MQELDSPVKKKSSASTGGGIKDTIESILVAFILAFVFRAFVVEAFVIPTGSMATTLLGAHTRFHCPDCGYDFDVNYQAPSNGVPESDDPAIPSTAGQLAGSVYCPNCGFEMPPSQMDNPPVFYGDRILVLKYLYLLQHPQRWDVVVFKAPIAMTTNYIKRLIGRPGEAVMVLDGDVYIRPPGAKDSRDFTVQTKPKAAQDALWRLVYDNDYHPQQQLDRGGVQAWRQPWTPVEGTAWNLTDAKTHGRTFTFDGDNVSSRLRFDPAANPTAQTISDYLTYDQQPSGQMPMRSVDSRFPTVATDSSMTNEIPVSDLDLRLTYQRNSGQGPLQLLLSKRDHTFTAEITPTQASLYHDYQGKRTQIGDSFALKQSSHPIRIEFSNADYQVTLRINGVIAAQTLPADFSPDIPALLQEYEYRRTPPPARVEIAASDQHSQVTHLSLWRDVFYYNDRSDRSKNVVWATPDDFPNHAQVLGPDEYFVMGDNSILSYDARCWTTGIDLPAEQLLTAPGRVPGRFLLGKAFYVYWPAGYFVPGIQNVSPAFVPNFGSMRFIH